MNETSRKRNSKNLIWLDLEMTGLDPATDEILEMAIVVTDRELEIVAEHETWVFACDADKLAGMDSWNQSMHTQTGLVDDVRVSQLGYEQAQAEALEFLRQWTEPNASPMCGNTICQDRRFIGRLLPRLHDYFHYRNFDVTAFKQAAAFWIKSMPSMPKKENRHRAKSDIIESITEMRMHRELLYKR